MKNRIYGFMKINNYKFGKITIDGTDYTNDVIILPGYVKSNWWRSQSHLLTLADIEECLGEKPEILLIGTGKFGLMRVKQEVIDYCGKNRVQLIIKDTTGAVKKFNELTDLDKRVIAALHLTC
jgi:hypothetical protein